MVSSHGDSGVRFETRAIHVRRDLGGVKGTSLFFLGESLRGIESLIELPAAMTHATIAGSPFGVSENLIRLPVGIEAVEALLADLAAGLG
jgi:cystathionine gamma-synthase